MIGATVGIPELTIEQLTKFEFVINRKTAKQLGLTIPPNVLARGQSHQMTVTSRQWSVASKNSGGVT
jgi:hypothetical protein